MLRNLLFALLSLAISAHAHADGKLLTVLSQKDKKLKAQDFFGAFDCTPERAKPGTGLMYAYIDKKVIDSKGNDIRKPGKVALILGSSKKRTYWGSAESLASGEVKLTFTDRKPVTLKFLRAKPTEDYDYQPFFSLKEDGGKLYLCGYSAD